MDQEEISVLEAVTKRLAELGGAVESKPLVVWCPPIQSAINAAQYIIGVDPASGIGGDFSCAQVIHRDTGLQCAELHGSLPLEELADAVDKLGRRYNDALLAVECNGVGQMVIARLGIAHYPNLYTQRSYPGWLTTYRTRQRMIEILAGLLKDQPELFQSRRLLDECRSFVRAESQARTDHTPDGSHDDCVVAMAIAQAVRAEVNG